MTVERSSGVAVQLGAVGAVVGGGRQGLTPELDETATLAAELLAERFAMPVTLRFNSDRASGGAFLVTHERDRVGANAEVGINVDLTTQAAHDVSDRLERETGEGLDLSPVGTITACAFVSRRVMPERYHDLCDDFHMDRYFCLPVPDVHCALAMVSALADLSLVDFSKEA